MRKLLAAQPNRKYRQGLVLREINSGKEKAKELQQDAEMKNPSSFGDCLNTALGPEAVLFHRIMLIKCSELIERKSWFIGPDVSRVCKHTLQVLKSPRCLLGEGRG